MQQKQSKNFDVFVTKNFVYFNMLFLRLISEKVEGTGRDIG